ncbi:MAG: ABC transporter permease [Elusimicrobia bacterium]|nr:ABC transporter permease [Elusimicrobiota bacterium]
MGGDKTGVMTNRRMFVRILAASLKERRSRVSIAFFSIMIGASVITALSCVHFDVSAKMSRELRAYGANVFIGPKDPSVARVLDARVVAEALSLLPAKNMVGASPYLYGVVRLDLGSAVLAGVDFSGLRRLSPYWQVDGRWIVVDFDDRSCMIGRALAKRMELKAGDSVTVTKNETGFHRKLRIKGVVETGQAEDERIFVNLALAGRILGQPGKVNHAMASVVSEGADIGAAAAGIGARFPGLEARPIRRISYSEGKILDKIKGLMVLIALIVLMVTTLCVMTTLIAIVAERTREIGLMKAIGADDRGVAVQFLSEALVIALAGIAAGLAAGFGLAQVLGQAVFGSRIAFRAEVLPVTIVLSLFAALIAVALPLKMAVRVVPAQVLKEE